YALGGGAPFTVTAGGASGSVAAGWKPGLVTADIAETHAVQRDAQVCVTNPGPAELSLGGASSPQPAFIDAAPQPGRATVDYLRPHDESWWSFAPVIADRIAGARGALPGGVTPYLWVVLALAAVGGLARRRLRLGAGAAVAVVAALNAL